MTIPNRLLHGAALATLALAAAAAQAQRASEVLPPQEAYPYTVEAGPDRLNVEFAVLDGYYLYRDKFGFESATDGITLGAPEYPAGEIHSDEFFGEQEIYRGEFTIEIPYSRSRPTEALDLEVRLQGCADVGLCYPPQRWNREVGLPAPAETGGVSLSDAARGEPDRLLPAEEAFVMNARFDAANELTVTWQIEPGYYLYRDKLEFTTDGGIGLGAPELPAGQAHHDENFGDVTVFYDRVEAVIPFSRTSPDAIPVTIRASYQGCRENSVCYPPDTRTMSLTVPASSEFAAPSDSGAGADARAGTGAADAAGGRVSEQDQLAARILGGSWWLVLGTFYALGLGLAFTPCVLPMVPILSGIIAGHGTVSASRGFALSATYVLGMAVTYTAAGALAALAGEQIQAIFQKPWIIATFAALFVALGLAMLGLFNLQMPAGVQARLSNLANRQKAGTFAGTAVVGALSALIVTTCVAPPLVATLAVIGQNGDVTRGSAALFAMSLGMGSPLLVVGASAGRLLPKAGPWMNAVKAAFGVMMLGLAIWMLERVLPGSVTLTLWALLVFLTGVFLGAFEPLPESPAPQRRLAKGVGVLACLYGALMLIGATLGGDDPLRPLPRATSLAGLAAPAESEPEPEFRSIETVAGLESALAEARAAGRPVMVDFTADWCIACQEMEEYTFPDPQVVAALEPFMLLRADVTANDDDDKALLKYFNSFGPPTIAFFDASGTEREGYKLVGFVPADEFAAHVDEVASL